MLTWYKQTQADSYSHVQWTKNDFLEVPFEFPQRDFVTEIT